MQEGARVMMTTLAIASFGEVLGMGPYIERISSDPCPSGYEDIITESDCNDVTLNMFWMQYAWSGSSSSDSNRAGCITSPVGGLQIIWNVHPTGSTGPSMQRNVCKVLPTPSPTAIPTPQPTAIAAVTGDPIFYVHGHRIKFDMPCGKKMSMWVDGTIQILAAADLVTFDKKSQWLSDIILLANSARVAHVQIRASNMGGHKNLGVTLFEQNVRHDVTKLGTYTIENGTYTLKLKQSEQLLGAEKKKLVDVNASTIAFSLSPELAQKFRDPSLALRYAHIDLRIHRMQSGVTAGLLAEFFGFVPMSSETASLIKTVNM